MSDDTTVAAAFQERWFLDRASWAFHRGFYRQWQRPMHPGEYSFLLKQIRHGTGIRLAHQVWRLTLPSGSFLVVRGTKVGLFGILPTGWTPSARQARAPRLPAVTPPAPVPEAAATAAAPPAPSPVRLQLGNRTGADELLAARLRRWG